MPIDKAHEIVLGSHGSLKRPSQHCNVIIHSTSNHVLFNINDVRPEIESPTGFLVLYNICADVRRTADLVL